MSKKERKVPELRFKGFHDDWEQRKLNMVFQNFIVPMRDKPKEFSGDIPWTRIEDIQGRYLHGSTSGKYVSEDTIKSMNLKVIPKDSIIVSVSATFGMVAIVTNDLITNQTFIGLEPKPNYNIDFLYSFFNSSRTRKKMKNESAGSTIFYITRKNIENMIGYFPSSKEQDKIGALLKSLDIVIALHQRKINILESQKKEYLNVMFSNNHYNPPLVRFRGFYENWSNNKLSNYLITSKLKNLDGFYGKKDVLSVSGVHGVVNQIKLQGRSFAGKSVLNYRVLNNEEIVYTKSPLKVAPHGIIKTNKGKAGIVSTLYAIYKTRENTNPNFVQTYFENELRLNKYLKPLVNKGAKNDMKVTDENVLNGLVSFPSLEEQMKISLFAERIENLIEVNQIQLNTIKRLKESYLRKIFL